MRSYTQGGLLPIPMKIYIAAKFSQRRELVELLPRLKEIGVIVTSTWIKEDEADFCELGSGILSQIGQRDIEDIENAHIVVIDTTGELNRGAGAGREFEAGYGLAFHKDFWRVGPARNPFHHSAGKSFETWEEFLIWVLNRRSL